MTHFQRLIAAGVPHDEALQSSALNEAQRIENFQQYALQAEPSDYERMLLRAYEFKYGSSRAA